MQFASRVQLTSPYFTSPRLAPVVARSLVAVAAAGAIVLGAGTASANVPALATPYHSPAGHYTVFMPQAPQVQQVPTTAADGSRITVTVVTGTTPDQRTAFTVSTTPVNGKSTNLDAGVNGLLRNVNNPTAVVRSSGSFQGHPSRTVSFNSAEGAQKVLSFIANGQDYTLIVIGSDTATVAADYDAFTAGFRFS